MSSYRIMKLSNGDEIICKLHNTENGYFKVGYPMKMCTVNTMGKDGKYEENLALRKWATFTKDKVFAIEKNQVVLHYEVNIGLCKYYEYILKRYDDAERYKNKDGDELKVDNDNIEVKEQRTTLEESDMEELIDEYQNVPYDYDETKH